MTDRQPTALSHDSTQCIGNVYARPIPLSYNCDLKAMERRVVDSTSLRSSGTDEDLEEARQRLLAHQEENGAGYTAPLSQHQQRDNQTRYGSVSTLQSSPAKKTPSMKRYRLPFLILLVFDWGLVVFLSIICSVVSNNVQTNVISLPSTRSCLPNSVIVCSFVVCWFFTNVLVATCLHWPIFYAYNLLCMRPFLKFSC